MARLLEVGDAAAKRIGEWLAELKVSELHPGPYTEQELERVSTSRGSSRCVAASDCGSACSRSSTASAN